MLGTIIRLQRHRVNCPISRVDILHLRRHFKQPDNKAEDVYGPELPYFDSSVALPDTPKKPDFDFDGRTPFPLPQEKGKLNQIR